MTAQDKANLIIQYEWLRRVLSELYAELATVDERLTELERVLPEDYVYPGDLSGTLRTTRCKKRL